MLRGNKNRKFFFFTEIGGKACHFTHIFPRTNPKGEGEALLNFPLSQSVLKNNNKLNGDLGARNMHFKSKISFLVVKLGTNSESKIQSYFEGPNWAP